jgi:ABC-2 type transport system ATP-binding protein
MAATTPLGTRPTSNQPLPFSPPAIMATGTPAIEVENLVRTFGDFTAVDGISFAVQPGEVFGFLGPNGAGKSTTIKMLCTLLKPTSGTARIDGHDVVKDPAGVRNSIGIIFQDYSLDDRITAEENLRFHCMIYHVPRSIRGERIAQVLAMVDLTDRAKDRVRTFSGGMKRRLEIARGLLHHPSVLFLDEPTVGLDPQTRQNIWEHINQLRKEHGITVFMTTHYMDEAEYCNRIAIMDHAHIIALDTPADLKASLGGDRIRLRTEDNEAAITILGSRYGQEALIEGDRVAFTVDHGDQFAPGLLQTFPIPVQSIEIARPTLNDVFLYITGREIRDEGADKHDKLRAAMQRRGNRGA